MANKNKSKGRRRVRKRAKLLLKTLTSNRPTRPAELFADKTIQSLSERATQSEPIFIDTAQSGEPTVKEERRSPNLTKSGNGANLRAVVNSLIVWPLKRRNAFTILSLGLCGLFVWLFFYFSRSTPTDVRGKLTQLGDVELTYGEFQVNSVTFMRML